MPLLELAMAVHGSSTKDKKSQNTVDVITVISVSNSVGVKQKENVILGKTHFCNGWGFLPITAKYMRLFKSFGEAEHRCHVASK
jgi:hypothetical protein